jgi:hypothetical protein
MRRAGGVVTVSKTAAIKRITEARELQRSALIKLRFEGQYEWATRANVVKQLRHAASKLEVLASDLERGA